MFSVDTRILRYKEKRILLNTSNGLWIRVSQKVYNLFVLVEKEGLSFNQLLVQRIINNCYIKQRPLHLH